MTFPASMPALRRTSAISRIVRYVPGCRPSELVRFLPALFAIGSFFSLPLSQLGCATPIRPSGGAIDSIPPMLLSSSPANGDVNVEAERLILEFSERLDASSASRAVSVAPAFDNAPQVQVSGRTIEIVFPDSLREQTTYVFSVGTELRDEHGVALQRPITMAFATGDILDRGRITGKLLDPASDNGLGGLQVFAYRLPAAFGGLDSLNIPPDSAETLFGGGDTLYRLPDPRTEAPTYSSEATGDGSFQFDYLREGPYFVAAIEDFNRNRRADTGERFALGAHPISVAITDSLVRTNDRPMDFFVAVKDTTAPALRRSRSISNRRFALSFDEPVRLRSLDAGDWSLLDSVSGDATRLTSVYKLPGSPSDVFLVADDALPSATYILSSTRAISDSTGNAASISTSLSSTLNPDTLSVRFEGFLPASAPSDSVFLLRPDTLPGVRFSQPVDSVALRQSVVVIGPEGSLAYTTETDDGVGFAIHLSTLLRTFRVEVRMPDSTYTRRFAIPSVDALGSISGSVEGQGEHTVRIEAHPESGRPYDSSTRPDGTFSIRQLPPGTYRLRAFVDRNSNGAWDGGSLAPYVPPEAVQWLFEAISVRARWEHEIEEAIDFGSK